MTFLFDEHFRGQGVKMAARNNRTSIYQVDAREVGGPDAPPRSTPDSEILLWCDANDCVLVSRDVNTVPFELKRFLESGHRSPGVLLVRRGTRLFDVVEHLAMISHASDQYEWVDRYEFIP